MRLRKKNDIFLYFGINDRKGIDGIDCSYIANKLLS